MKKWNIMLFMLLGSVVTFQACKDDDDDEISMDRQAFVTQAGSGNMLEIEAGNLAVQKAENQDVKEFGTHMVTDHTAASAQLLAIITPKNLTMPTDLTTVHQQQYNTLTPLTGTTFDKAFMSLMVQSHQEQVDLFDKASKQLADAELRNFAAEKLPTLRAHLQEAQQLNAIINP